MEGKPLKLKKGAKESPNSDTTGGAIAPPVVSFLRRFDSRDGRFTISTIKITIGVLSAKIYEWIGQK